MRLLINTSNLKLGGGIQVALSLINEFKNFHENEYHILYSSSLTNQLQIKDFPKNFCFYYIDYSPIYLPKTFITLIQLNQIEKKVHPDCVLSIFGPSYWRPNALHIMGFALGYFLYPESPFWKTLRFKEKLYIKLLKTLKTWQIKRNAKYFHIETQDAKLRLNKFYNIPLKNILVASNTYHNIFNNYNGNLNVTMPPKGINEFRLLSISAFFPHKNLTIINDVISELNKQKEFYFKFFVTIPNNIFKKKFINSGHLENIGPVKIHECPSIYAQSDALFQPTLLEIFSVSYLEAMKMGLPILTSDLPFAHDVCKNAAEYFEPLNPLKIAESILKVAKNKVYRDSLKDNGFKRLNDFDTSKQRAEKILNFCTKIINKNV
jgi:glycosyltransferase involved in cell wall biosynthesis